MPTGGKNNYNANTAPQQGYGGQQYASPQQEYGQPQYGQPQYGAPQYEQQQGTYPTTPKPAYTGGQQGYEMNNGGYQPPPGPPPGQYR